MVTINKKIIPSSKYSIKAPFTMKPQYITIHNTANDASAKNEISYMTNNNNQVSYHYAVDDIQIIQAIPDNRTAWHCGDGRGPGNMKSIGIEICYSRSGGPRYTKAEDNAVQLTAYRLHKYNLPISAVKQHYDWSRKNCPHRIRATGTWFNFINRVKRALEALKKPAVKGVTITNPTPSNTPKNKGETPRMFKPTSNTLKQEFETLLKDAKSKGILTSDAWLDKLQKGQLTLDDAIGLVVTIHNRKEK